MKAYRVHLRNVTEIGPFYINNNDQRSVKLIDALYRNLDSQAHPIPLWDNMSKPWSGDHVFGVSSLEQIEQWFSGVYAELFDDDYVIGVFEINENTSSVGDNQVAFVLADAFVVETLEFTDLV